MPLPFALNPILDHLPVYHPGRPIEEVARFLPPHQSEPYDVAIGSREAKGAKRYNEPIHRHLMGRVNNFLIKLIALRGFERPRGDCTGFVLPAQRASAPTRVEIFPLTVGVVGIWSLHPAGTSARGSHERAKRATRSASIPSREPRCSRDGPGRVSVESAEMTETWRG